MSATEHDALGDILDICHGFTRAMTERERLDAIYEIALKAWRAEHFAQAAPAEHEQGHR